MEFLDDYLNHYNSIQGKGHIALPSGNHDINPRLSKSRNDDDLELVFLFLMTMPGVPFIWYGDEIGMRSFDHMVSKEGGYNRTGARTPMQWSDAANAGFSTAAPDALYLPIDTAIDRPSVSQQENSSGSLLQRVRNLVAIRKDHPALQASAQFKILFAQPGICPLIYQRSDEDETFIIAINPSAQDVDTDIPSVNDTVLQTLYGPHNVFHLENNNWKIHLPGRSGGIYRLGKS
jgi:maltose alpha-D-glucosyltransferase/alpha-amylase